MALAQIGPLTTLSEAAASAVGAGVVLGSVAFGLASALAGRSRREMESRAIVGGYASGAVGALFALVDTVLSYIS